MARRNPGSASRPAAGPDTGRPSTTIDIADPEPRSASDPDETRRRLAAELDLAREELKDAILEATNVSRRVKDLEMALRRAEWRAEQRQPAAR